MNRNSLKCHFIFLLVLVLDLFYQVVSEYCGNEKYCQPPYKCCANKQACCYDHDNNNNYTRGFKLHVWNMWYFWLVIIFILMSCFGGCGYYRRRRMAAMQQGLSTSLSTSQSPRRVCTSRQRRHTPQPDVYAYTGPGADTVTDMHLPPPYTEVMQQPQLYPVNKVDLPPYPGPPVDKDPNNPVDRREEAVNPPPYCEAVLPPTAPSEGGSSSAPVEHVAVPMELGQQAEHRGSAGAGDGVGNHSSWALAPGSS